MDEVTHLIVKLGNIQYYFERKAIVESLGKIGDPRAIPALIEASKFKNEGIHIALVEALVQIGNPAVPALIKALEYHAQERSLCWVCVAALGRIGAPEAVPSLLATLRNKGYIAAFQVEAYYVGTKAVEALGMIGQPAIPALIQALEDLNYVVGLGAVQALIQIGTPAVPAIIEALNDKNSRTAPLYRRALEVLAAIGDNRAAPVFAEALRDNRDYIRHSASAALENIGYSEEILLRIVPLLIDALTDDNADVQDLAAKALGEIGQYHTIPVIPALVRSLKDRYSKINKAASSMMRSSTAEALGKIAARNPTPVLRSALPILKAMQHSYNEGRYGTNYQSIIERIEEATAHMKDLPLTAAPEPSRENLPVIATAPFPTTEDTNNNQDKHNAVQGWHQSLKHFLRGSKSKS